MALDKLYQQIVLDHNRAPRNAGPLAGATHRARGRDALCGDDIVMELIVRAGRIERAAFSGEACAVTTASASMLTEWLQDRETGAVAVTLARLERALAQPDGAPDTELGEFDRLRAVGHFPARVRNVLLPWRTALRALGTLPA